MNDFLDRNLSGNQKRQFFNPMSNKTIERMSRLCGLIPINKRRNSRNLNISNCTFRPHTMGWLTSEYNITPLPFMHGVLNDKIYCDNIRLYDDNEVVTEPSLLIGCRCRHQYPISVRSK